MTDLNLKLKTVLTDLLALSTGGIIILVLFIGVTPTRRGFYCQDETIRYPFHESTIPNWALYIFTFSIPCVVITSTEFLSHRRSHESATFLSRPVPTWFFHMYRSFVDFLFGCATSQLFTDVGKYTIGRLRPNFMDVCQPNVTLTHCNMYGNTYIENYVCMKSDNDAKESRVSFPSGHSSFSAYTMLYIAIYIQVKWMVNKRSTFRLVKGAVQLSLCLLAYYTALSRVMDNKHHWSDVSVGALIGVVTASLTVKYVSCLLQGHAPTRTNSETKVAYSINSGNVEASIANNRFDMESPHDPKDGMPSAMRLGSTD